MGGPAQWPPFLFLSVSQGQCWGPARLELPPPFPFKPTPSRSSTLSPAHLLSGSEPGALQTSLLSSAEAPPSSQLQLPAQLGSFRQDARTSAAAQAGWEPLARASAFLLG